MISFQLLSYDSFIHYMDLYIASSRPLLRRAPTLARLKGAA